MKTTKSPTGRPTKYTEELGREIYERMSAGELLCDICDLPHMPTRVTVWAWKDIDKHPEFLNLYAQAELNQARARADFLIKRSLDESRDYQPDGKGGTRSDNTAVQRDKLITDNLKWLMARRSQKEYGEKLTQELTGADGAQLVPIVNVTISGPTEGD